jgi:hypothetical protein
LDYFKYYILPAAGPKAFVSSGFEYKLYDQFRTGNIHGKKWFIGGSTGALRAFAFISSLITGKDHTEMVKDQYCEMYYQKGTTPDCLHKMMLELFQICANPKLVDQILHHETFNIAVMVCQLRSTFSYLPLFMLRPILAAIAIGNCFSPQWLHFGFQRICFYSGDAPPPCLVEDRTIKFCKLTVENAHHVLHATTCIPFVSRPCTFIEGLGYGLFMDAGVTDYYLNFRIQQPGILLGDIHPEEVIPRSALDGFLPWKRQLPEDYFEHCTVVRPTQEFILSFPQRKLPSVRDWFTEEFITNPQKRHRYWNQVFHLSRKHWWPEIKG